MYRTSRGAYLVKLGYALDYDGPAFATTPASESLGDIYGCTCY